MSRRGRRRNRLGQVYQLDGLRGPTVRVVASTDQGNCQDPHSGRTQQ